MITDHCLTLAPSPASLLLLSQTLSCWSSATLLVLTPRVSTVLMVPVSLLAVYTVRFSPDTQLEGGRSVTMNLGFSEVMFWSSSPEDLSLTSR